MDAEIKNLVEAGHFKRVDKITDDLFILSLVITVKKDRSVKIALDAILPKNSILKKKYQMPNLESLKEKVTEAVKANKDSELFFTSLDKQCVYGQTLLHPDTPNIEISRL